MRERDRVEEGMWIVGRCGWGEGLRGACDFITDQAEKNLRKKNISTSHRPRAGNLRTRPLINPLLTPTSTPSSLLSLLTVRK